MPTGYTAGIIDGSIKTFPEFAKKCMRAFGATIHMKEDGLNVEYTEMKPSDYHVNKHNEANHKLSEVLKITDEELIELRKKELNDEINLRKENITKTEKTIFKLNHILAEVKKWEVPLAEYNAFKKFMIQQIESTLEFDGNTQYDYEKMKESEDELLSLDANKIREKKIEQFKKDLAYHFKENLEEIQRCNKANKWITNLLISLQ